MAFHRKKNRLLQSRRGLSASTAWSAVEPRGDSLPPLQAAASRCMPLHAAAGPLGCPFGFYWICIVVLYYSVVLDWHWIGMGFALPWHWLGVCLALVWHCPALVWIWICVGWLRLSPGSALAIDFALACKFAWSVGMGD